MKIRTDYWPKPIPPRQFDWTAIDENYEPGGHIGFGRTEQEAIDDLKALVDADNDQFGVGA